MEAGIYFHIPFCKQACHYCNFHFSTSLKNKTALLDAIAGEIDLRKKEWQNSHYKSIYFGGGTPSLLSEKEINNLLQKVKSNFQVNKNAEITLEANPDDLSKNYLEKLLHAGINRLSIGVQSFFDKDLKFMNRAHSAKEALEVIEQAHLLGFENISIDLIYGIPGMSIAEWKENLKIAAALPINHISCYALTLEPNTAFSHFVKKGKYQAPNDSEAEAHFQILQEKAETYNWDHYEISNIAINGYRAIHNSSYWNGNPYLGLGPSAHSFDGENKRLWNVSNNSKYIKAILAKENCSEFEILSPQDRFNEMLMTGLRQKEGISYLQMEKLLPEKKQQEKFKSYLKKLEEKNWLENNGDRWAIEKESIFLADHIISELFWV